MLHWFLPTNGDSRTDLSLGNAVGAAGSVPAVYGGPDLSPVVLAEVIRTIAAVDPAIAQIPQAHYLFVDVLAVHGSAEQQRRLFADVLAGARLGNGLAERGGTHAQDLKTRLRPWPDGRGRDALRLDGRKYYCTGAISARWIGVSALDSDGRLVLSFIERNAPGLQLTDDWNVMGQRATVSGSAVFDGVPVDPGLVVPYADVFEVPQQLGARSQLVHAAIQVGIAGGALRDAGEYVRTKARPFFEAARAGWADTAAADPHTIHRFGRLATQVAAAEALLAAAAATLEEVTRFPRDAAAAARGSIAVNVLAAPQQELSANFARRGLAAAWDGVRHRPGLTSSPRLHGVLATLECTVEHQLPGGDHEIVVGRVLAIELANTGTDGTQASPLLFWRGRYASLGVMASGGS